MKNLICAEWLKIRRCQILLVGIVALALCPVAQYATQLLQAPEFRQPDYDFARFFANVVWGNSQIFLPISLVMIGGWCIDRETAHDTLKNVVVVPVSMPELLGAKLLMTAMLAAVFGVYSAAMALLTGLAVGIPGLTLSLALHGTAQIVAAAMTTFLVCLPLILIFGQIRGAYLGGSILTFFLGYSMLFFKNGLLANAYPFSAALILVGFDMREYNGAKTPPRLFPAAVGVASMVLLALLLLALSNRRPAPGPQKPAKPHPGKRPPSQRPRRGRKSQ